MSVFLWIITCVSAGLFLLMLFDIFMNDGDNAPGYIIALVLIGTFGYGIIAGARSCKKYTTTEKANVDEILIGRHATLIVADSKTIVISGYDADEINDSTEFHWVIKHNHYNLMETSRSLVYKSVVIQNKDDVDIDNIADIGDQNIN